MQITYFTTYLFYNLGEFKKGVKPLLVLAQISLFVPFFTAMIFVLYILRHFNIHNRGTIIFVLMLLVVPFLVFGNKLGRFVAYKMFLNRHRFRYFRKAPTRCLVTLIGTYLSIIIGGVTFLILTK